MAYNIHDYGDAVRVAAQFSDAVLGGVLDPETVKLTVRQPDGTVTTLTYGTDDIEQEDVGIYYADISANQSGEWFYRWWSEGTGQASKERRFVVREAMAVD